MQELNTEDRTNPPHQDGVFCIGSAGILKTSVQSGYIGHKEYEPNIKKINGTQGIELPFAYCHAFEFVLEPRHKEY